MSGEITGGGGEGISQNKGQVSGEVAELGAGGGKSIPPHTTITLEKTIRWKDVRELTYQAIEYGVPSDFESRKLAQLSLKLLGKRQGKSSLNLSFYSTLLQCLDYLTEDEVRRLALQCISRCTDTEENCHNITSIATKVSSINTRYFDYRYRNKPYIVNKPLSIVDQEIAKATLTGALKDEVLVEEKVDGGFDIVNALGYLPFGGEL